MGVAILTNDLRNLLTVMVSCIDAIRSSVPPHPVVDHSFVELDGAIYSAFYISREMLGIARPHRVEPAVLDVNELIAQAKGVLKRIVGNDIRLSLDLAAPSPIVRADVVQLEWVLLNLAANAADAMPQGGLFKIETATVDIPSDVATEAATAARRHVRIT